MKHQTCLPKLWWTFQKLLACGNISKNALFQVTCVWPITSHVNSEVWHSDVFYVCVGSRDVRRTNHVIHLSFKHITDNSLQCWTAFNYYRQHAAVLNVIWNVTDSMLQCWMSLKHITDNMLQCWTSFKYYRQHAAVLNAILNVTDYMMQCWWHHVL